MSGVHRINLSTAWQPPAAGSTAWMRRFGRPDGLEPASRVWLVHERGSGVRLILNGKPLPAGRRHDVTTALAKRNELLLLPLPPIPAAQQAVAGRVGTAGSAEDGTDEGGRPAPGRRPLDPRLGRLHLEIVPSHP